MSIPTWAVLRAAGVEDSDADAVLRRAEREVEHWRPDGAREYVPITEAYSVFLATGMRPSTVGDIVSPFLPILVEVDGKKYLYADVTGYEAAAAWLSEHPLKPNTGAKIWFVCKDGLIED